MDSKGWIIVMRILTITLLSTFIASSLAQLTETAAEINKKCEAATTSCDQCIQAHPQCAWCRKGENDVNIKRCRSLAKFTEEGGCEEGKMENPLSDVELRQDEPFSIAGSVGVDDPVVQLKPQRIHLELRKGETMKFNVTFQKVSDYPVDLYYVMDLSNSMNDDLDVLKKLGETLARDIRSNVTQNIQLGFGTFVDKVMMPFASTVEEQMQNPCVKNQGGDTCAPPFGFKHQHSISPDLTKFQAAVESTRISGNIDSPEGGFDALMQIAVCTDQIGWRNESTHLVVFTTDASFHMALDGKLAAILEMNDMQCHLDKVSNSKGINEFLPPDDIVYSMSQELDYPSIGQLRHAFNKYKIQPIFAVTKEVKSLYDGLRELIPNSHVDQLAADSSNIIGIIKDAYNKLKGKLEMTWANKPDSVDMNYRVKCPGEQQWKEQSLKCDNITIGSKVTYEFEITARECPEEAEIQPMTFTSSSLQESVTITFGFKCDCNCTGHPMLNSDECSTNGSLVCGICSCYAPHEGAQCQCTRERKDESLNEKCKKDGTTDDECEGQGSCECGICVCNNGRTGKFCECSNKGCPKDAGGLICGGPDKGTCLNCNDNQACKCKGEWKQEPTMKTCICHTKLCKQYENDTDVCNGNGLCDCNRCTCNDTTRYVGKYCETCIHPDCKEVKHGCEGDEMRACAQCVNEAQRKRKNVVETCRDQCGSIEYVTLPAIPDCGNCGTDKTCTRICDSIDRDISPARECTSQISGSECDIRFEVVWKKSTNDYMLWVKEFNKKDDCRPPINPLYIVLPIVAGIVMLGLLALAAWKIYQTIHDKKEWENFEKEMKQSRWTKGQNPIFQKPFTKFQNPTYQE